MSEETAATPLLTETATQVAGHDLRLLLDGAQGRSALLQLIAEGRANKEAAADLGISIKPVEAHRANIMEKLNANTVADLLKIALGAQGKS